MKTQGNSLRSSGNAIHVSLMKENLRGPSFNDHIL